MDISKIVTIVLAVLGGLRLVLAVIAPLTKNETDNKLLTYVQKLEDLLVRVMVPAKYLPPKAGK